MGTFIMKIQNGKRFQYVFIFQIMKFFIHQNKPAPYLGTIDFSLIFGSVYLIGARCELYLILKTTWKIIISTYCDKMADFKTTNSKN